MRDHGSSLYKSMFYECIMVEPLSVRELVASHTLLSLALQLRRKGGE